MNTKFKILSIILSLAVITFFSSCGEDINKPEINDLEVGLDNSLVAYIGADLHVEAEIVAEGRIDKITVDIHKEDGSGEEIEEVWDEFSGLKNTTFHKHIDIPEGTTAGEYHFHLYVTDQEGNQSSVEKDISIEDLVDDEAPELSVTSSPTNGQSFSDGQSITIAGHVEDNIALGGMIVALVYESDNISDEDVAGDNDKVVVMLHTHDFDDPDETDFSASINVGAAKDNNIEPANIEGNNAWKSGNYYILVKAVDAGGNWVYSEHYPIVVNL
ncbi:MAG: DUF4625 domain-containing protein [Saprospiraceae bacterium]